MAEIDKLIARVPDEALRKRLETSVAHLRDDKDFGLVFEHSAESVALYGMPAKPGMKVRLRREPTDQAEYEVIKVSSKGDRVTITDPAGKERALPARDLLIVKSFGEPMYPVLTPAGGVRRGAEDRPHHAVLGGENYHALQSLLYLYKGQVDCIYLDPPYNTLATSWRYNNKIVDGNDIYRHSKWLSMMERRLKLAKKLLRRDGVLIITIDEHEVHHLGMLLERIFPSALTQMITIVHNPKGTYKKNFARVDEYAFFVCPSGQEVISQLPEELFEQAASPEAMERAAARLAKTENLYLRRRGQESGHRHQRPNQFYAILVDEEKQEVVGLGPALAKDEPYKITKTGNVTTVYPLDTRGDERVWRYKRKTMQEYIDAGAIVVSGFSKRAKQGWVLNHSVTSRSLKRVKSVWWEKRHDAGMSGSELLSAYLGEAAQFPFPKSVYAVRDCLDAVVRGRPDALIVDLFAGSGTTFHATCLLNEQDGGRRRSVLVTNNEVDGARAKRLWADGLFEGDPAFEEHGIFEQVTCPRTQAVVTGKRADGTAVPGVHVWAGRRPYSEGFEENVEFFKLEYRDPDDIDLGRQLEAIIPSLWLAAGGVGEREAPSLTKGWSVPKGSTYGLLLNESRFPQFAQELAKRPEVTHVWIVTDSHDALAEMTARLRRDLRVSMLYRDYLRNFVINVERDA